MSVGAGVSDRCHADSAIRSRPVFDDDILAPSLRQILRQDSGDDTAGAAHLIWRHDRNSAGREHVCVRVCACRQSQNNSDNATQHNATFDSQVRYFGISLAAFPRSIACKSAALNRPVSCSSAAVPLAVRNGKSVPNSTCDDDTSFMSDVSG